AHPVFEGTELDRLRPLLADVTSRVFAAGETVSRPETSVPVAHLLLEGRLCLFQLTREGRRVILDYIEPGGVDGMRLAGPRHGHFAVALERSRLAALSPALIANLIHLDPQFAINLLREAGDRLRRREEHLERLVLRDPAQRLAGQLLALSEDIAPREGRWFIPRVSHEALGDMLGLARETVTLHLGRLRRLGVVLVEADRFVLDRAALTAIYEGEPEPGASVSEAHRLA
ncbi:MAG: Crp/Fnr family transcriptional regulator, partial [Candidatus Dormibacteraeota bacterium]|nr:Crp/Fnr family transcriptional regulator [Candidatus Dormibacteraeota bacterium]